MIYSRLKLCRDLLTNDGMVFISIDDNEFENLIKICNEVFGSGNQVGVITWSKKRKGSFLSKRMISLTEYIVVYARDLREAYLFGGVADSNESQPIIKRTNNISTLTFKQGWIETKLPDGVYGKGVYGQDVNPVELLDAVSFKKGRNVNEFRLKAPFVWSQDFLNRQVDAGARLLINTANFQVRAIKAYDEENFKGFPSFINGVEIGGTNEDAYEELERIFNVKKLFDYSKPSNLIKELILGATHFDSDGIVLDFFAGSSTTAHAVMQLNAEDGGNRKFIMVQLPEETDEKSEAYKAGYKTISDIGKERIRRAGEKIKAEVKEANAKLKDGEEPKKVPDIGFRVLKVDSTNMKDVYYAANEVSQDMLFDLEFNIKEDRSDLDLLYGVLVDWGLPLSLSHEIESFDGVDIHTVDHGSLIACFADDISENVVREIAKRQPLRAVFRDSSFGSSPQRINVEEIFKLLAPRTSVRVI